MRPMIAAVCFLLAAPVVAPQTKPTPAELGAWKKDPAAQILESTPCKKITWLLEAEGSNSEFRRSIGWWGRGFVEGATLMIDGKAGDLARKRVSEFGLSADVVAAHISTYCYANPTKTPWDAAVDLTLKAM